MNTRPRPKKCRNPECRREFVPVRPLQIACCMTCAIVVGRAKTLSDEAKAEKARRAERRAERLADREKLKRRSDHLADTQQAFNAWIRERDYDQPCISCGRHHQGQYHAGHYLTVGSHPELRFEPLNVHKQCAPCNDHKSGNVVAYRVRLIAKIGQEAVEWLEGPHEPKHYEVEELRAMTKHFRAEVRRMQRARERETIYEPQSV